VLVVEAMKMEHTVTAPVDGVVSELTAKAGQQVRMDESLAVIGAAITEGGPIGPQTTEGGSLGAPGYS
ncbi:MAG TPA: biotin/lipoyl-containing protein, partial [Trebonia sp.]